MKINTIKNLLFSMRTAITILLVLIVACIAGSMIPQGELEAYYTGYYPGTAGQLILFLHLNDVFHSIWFVVLTILLCLNLLGCNLIRFPALIRQMKTGFTAQKRVNSSNGEFDAKALEKPEQLFQTLGFSHVESGLNSAGRNYRYAVRHKIGIWGAWLTHLGMLVIIIGFALGQMYTVKYVVYGVQGETLPVEGTSYAVTIDDFRVLLREDETVEQYISALTVTDTATGESVTGETSVNHPMTAHHMKLYQNSTGWAAKVTVLKEDIILQQELLCAGEQLTVPDLPDLVLAFNAFYPDYALINGQPATVSTAMNNPGYLYTLYYQGRVMGMNVLTGEDRITVDAYTFIFSDPESYTLIQLKHDPYTWIAFLGAALILMALILAFYLRTEELWAVQQEDGRWSAAGFSRKGGVLFHEKIAETAQELAAQKQA